MLLSSLYFMYHLLTLSIVIALSRLSPYLPAHTPLVSDTCAPYCSCIACQLSLELSYQGSRFRGFSRDSGKLFEVDCAQCEMVIAIEASPRLPSGLSRLDHISFVYFCYFPGMTALTLGGFSGITVLSEEFCPL